MKRTVSDLAILGGQPSFETPLPVGQLNFPDWDRFETAFRGIFDRRYYTNHGPLAQELEARLSDFLGVRHVVCMTNATIGLMIAAKALGIEGKVILPGFTFIATARSVSWAGLEPVFCDVDLDSHLMLADQVAPLIDNQVSAILGVHLWGNPDDPIALQELAHQHGLHLYFDAAHAFGCSRAGVPIGGFGRLEVFSFHATKILNAAEGGCVTTNDDELAARLRNVRSSYGAGEPVDIPLTGNGRMSEAQAAMALLSLDDYSDIRRRNKAYFELYTSLLEGLPGIRVQRPGAGNSSNYQYVVLAIDSDAFGLSRDSLVALLGAENVLSRRYFSPGLHRAFPYDEKYPQYRNALPNTDRLAESVMQLPSGQAMSLESIKTVCRIIELAHKDAPAIRDKLRGVP